MPKPTPGMTIRQLAERDERVFSTYPQVGRYFAAAAMEDSRKRLGRAIERGDGPGLVIGAPGMGKSLLLQVLASQFHERFDVVLLACARLCTRRALLQAVLFELGLPYKRRDEGALRLSLLDHLLSAEDCPSGLLLLVDEAQTLPVALLDELRVLTNLVRGDRPRVRLVLAGNSSLEESFAHPDLESFSQRLATRCYVTASSRDETRQFIRAQLAAANGAPEEIVAADAWDAIFETTDGVPRLVNQLCDRALQFAAADGCENIDRDIVERAWSDLQQLPAAWEAPRTAHLAASGSPVIEFGSLAVDVTRDDAYVNEDANADTEPTELDFESNAPSKTASDKIVADPFAEEFAEEEIVLDSFAAWDDMFRREMPRVSNLRDPGFATLVQTAIDASPAGKTKYSETPSFYVLRQRDSEELEEPQPVREPTISSRRSGASATKRSDEGWDTDSNWPPLRLAVVSGPGPLKPIPLLPPSASIDAVADAWDKLMTTIELNQGAAKKSEMLPPVLVVEEDSTHGKPNPPVRRESYRNLFSRLRSG